MAIMSTPLLGFSQITSNTCHSFLLILDVRSCGNKPYYSYLGVFNFYCPVNSAQARGAFVGLVLGGGRKT